MTCLDKTFTITNQKTVNEYQYDKLYGAYVNRKVNASSKLNRQ